MTAQQFEVLAMITILHVITQYREQERGIFCSDCAHTRTIPSDQSTCYNVRYYFIKPDI